MSPPFHLCQQLSKVWSLQILCFARRPSEYHPFPKLSSITLLVHICGRIALGASRRDLRIALLHLSTTAIPVVTAVLDAASHTAQYALNFGIVSMALSCSYHTNISKFRLGSFGTDFRLFPCDTVKFVFFFYFSA